MAQHVNKVYNQMLVTFFGIDGMTALNMYLRWIGCVDFQRASLKIAVKLKIIIW